MKKSTWTIVLAVALTAVIVLGFVFFGDKKDEAPVEDPVTSAVSYNGGILVLSETSETTDEDKTLEERNEEGVKDLAERMQEEPVMFTVLAVLVVVALVAAGVVLAPKFSNKFGR